MSPSKATEDYYFILKVDQKDDLETITTSWKRLALLLHPDKNPGKDTTAEFQLLAIAYDTLKDPAKRREYNSLYPQIRKTKPTSKSSPQNQWSSKASETEFSEAVHITALEKAKLDRETEFVKSRTIIDREIFELRRKLNQLKTAVELFEKIERAEKAEREAANRWSTWILSPLYKKAIETQEEKENKANERIQRLHAKGMKERAVDATQARITENQRNLREREERMRVENSKDDAKITRLTQSLRIKREKEQAEIRRAQWEATEKLWREAQEKERVEREAMERVRKAREEKERVEREARERVRRVQEQKERVEREAMERVRKVREEKERVEREARERVRRVQEQKERMAREKNEEARRAREAAEKQAREKQEREIVRKARQDQINRMRKEDELKGIIRDSYDRLVAKEPVRNISGFILYFPTPGDALLHVPKPVTYTSRACSHAGWWPQHNTRAACEECGVFRRNYLLQCPDCKMMACPKCQAKLRPRGSHKAAIPTAPGMLR